MMDRCVPLFSYTMIFPSARSGDVIVLLGVPGGLEAAEERLLGG